MDSASSTGVASQNLRNWPISNDGVMCTSSASNTQLNQDRNNVSMPILAKHRYGREEFLALYPVTTTSKVPDAVRETMNKFYVDNSQEPVSVQPFTAVEQRLLFQGVNSSTALSLAKRTEFKTSTVPFEQLTNISVPPAQLPRAAGIGRGIIRTSGSAVPPVGIGIGIGKGRGLLGLEQQQRNLSIGSNNSSSLSSAVELKPPAKSVSSVAVPSLESARGALLEIVDPRSVRTVSPALDSSNGCNAESSALQPTTNQVNEAVSGTRDTNERWLYLDPTGAVQGPFIAGDMADWFGLGYFTMQLMIRREVDKEFISLGDEIKRCGRIPFMRGEPSEKSRPSEHASNSKECSRAPSSASSAGSNIVRPVPQYPHGSQGPMPTQTEQTNAMGIAPQRSGHSVQSEAGSARSTSASSVEPELVPLFPQEQQQGKSGNIGKQPNQSATAVLRAKLAMIEQEREPKRQQEEENQRKLAEEQKRVTERLQFEERLKQIEEQIKAERELSSAASNEPQLSRRLPKPPVADSANAALRARVVLMEQRLKEEREEKRRQEEEAQLKLAEAEKLEEERRLAEERELQERLNQIQEQIKAEQEMQRKAMEAQQRAEQEMEKRRRMEMEEQRRREERASRQEYETRRMAAVLAEEERLRQLRLQQEYGQIPPTRPAPWATHDTPTQTWCLPPHQQEVQSLNEIAAEEIRQIKAEKRQEALLAMDKRKNDNQSHTGNPWRTTANRNDADDGLWSTEFLSSGSNPTRRNGGDTDGFTKWCTKQVKGLNSEIDASATVEHLKQIQSSNDAKDFIFSYFGDCRPAREFLEAFIQRRRMAPCAVPPVQTRTGDKPAQQKPMGEKQKKTGKGAKVIVDGRALGFTSTADSSRVNAGAIDQSSL